LYLVINLLFVCCALLTLAGEGHSYYDAKGKKKKNQLALNQQLKQLRYSILHLLFRAFWNWRKHHLYKNFTSE